jgi:hypothetical protein
MVLFDLNAIGRKSAAESETSVSHADQKMRLRMSSWSGSSSEDKDGGSTCKPRSMHI